MFLFILDNKKVSDYLSDTFFVSTFLGSSILFAKFFKKSDVAFLTSLAAFSTAGVPFSTATLTRSSALFFITKALSLAIC